MKPPEHLEEWADRYSNFDNQHPGEDAEAAIRDGTHFIIHPAWDHWGEIWFADGRFVENVMVHHVDQSLVYGDTLKEVFDAVNEVHGLL